jgi:hypothetical protein
MRPSQEESSREYYRHISFLDSFHSAYSKEEILPVDKKKNTPPNDKGATPNVVSADQLKPEHFHHSLRTEIRDATRTVMEDIMREELSRFL